MRHSDITTENLFGYEHNLSDELVRSEKVNLANSALLDRETWGLDKGGNWLSYTRSSDNLMQTRSIDVMNRLQQTGGAGTTVIEGGVNEMADVTVNSQPAELRADPATGGYRYRKAVPVTQGTNTVNVTAVDKDNPPNTTSQDWEFNVPGVQRSFTYDANGNTLSDGQRTFTWDAKNRLKTVTVNYATGAYSGGGGGRGGPWSETWTWDYDYRDRRVRETYSNVNGPPIATPNWGTQFIWRDTELVQERVGTSATAGTPRRAHLFGGFEDRNTTGTVVKKNYLVTSDHLGHTREVIVGNTNAGTVGTLVARYDYSPYQGPTKVFGTTINASLLTIGRYYHHYDSGLELALYRAYDPELGRWMSEDPLGEEGGINLYGFNVNDPVHRIDKHGEWGLLIAIGTAVVGAATFIYKAYQAAKACDKAGEERRAALKHGDVGTLVGSSRGKTVNDALKKVQAAASSAPTGTSTTGPVTLGPKTEAGEACETGYDVVLFLYDVLGLHEVPAK